MGKAKRDGNALDVWRVAVCQCSETLQERVNLALRDSAAQAAERGRQRVDQHLQAALRSREGVDDVDVAQASLVDASREARNENPAIRDLGMIRIRSAAVESSVDSTEYAVRDRARKLWRVIKDGN